MSATVSDLGADKAGCVYLEAKGEEEEGQDVAG